jgi:hypothetical protein
MAVGGLSNGFMGMQGGQAAQSGSLADMMRNDPRMQSQMIAQAQYNAAVQAQPPLYQFRDAVKGMLLGAENRKPAWHNARRIDHALVRKLGISAHDLDKRGYVLRDYGNYWERPPRPGDVLKADEYPMPAPIAPKPPTNHQKLRTEIEAWLPKLRAAT